jgi:DNA-3-methyladenine glycosylase II
MARGFDLSLAHAHLCHVDRDLARWMARVEPVRDESGWRRRLDLVDALARSILSQQLSGKAAATIIGRLEVACGQACIDAQVLSQMSEPDLRACGVSRAKAMALADLAAHQVRGELPSARQMAQMPDEAIIECLTRVRGVGRWTAEMLLVFQLGRPDILPLDDLGIRKGLRIVEGGEMPSRHRLAERGEVWAPFRSLAARYLWRIADSGFQ